MSKDRIIDVDADSHLVAEIMQTETVEVHGVESALGDIANDIQTAHKQLDEYKSGSLSLAKTLSEAAKETDDDTLAAILNDLSDGAFGVYLRVQRGDLELMGDRDGEYAGFLTE